MKNFVRIGLVVAVVFASRLSFAAACLAHEEQICTDACNDDADVRGVPHSWAHSTCEALSGNQGQQNVSMVISCTCVLSAPTPPPERDPYPGGGYGPFYFSFTRLAPEGQ